MGDEAMAKIIRGVFNLGRRLTVTLVGALLVVAFLAASEHETRHSSMAAQQRVTSAQDMLSLANFYYNSNDTSDIAAKQYNLVISKYPNSEEAEAAQYYLGSYYHRKFYIRKERWKSEYKPSLIQAESEYKRYISRYSKAQSPQWLCDARFNISLAYMEEGNFFSAIDQLRTIVLFDSAQDASVYIHQVIWSENPKDVIDQAFNAKQLAEYAVSLANVHGSRGDIEPIVSYIMKWCRDEKNQQSAR